MTSRSIAGLHAHRINTTAPRILERIKLITTHLGFLSGLSESKAIEPRELLRCVNEAREDALQLHHQITELAELRSGLRRRHLGDGYDTFANGYQGVTKRIAIEFDKLDAAAKKLQKLSEDRLNDPGRYGDAAASGPVADLIGFIFQLLEFWGLLRVRKKLD